MFINLGLGNFAFNLSAINFDAVPQPLRATKALMKHDHVAADQAKMAEEMRHFGRMLTAPEAKEAFTAFFEKRSPDFSRFS